MKQFIYDAPVIGLSDWPPGTLRLEGIEVTTDPNQADVFVTPGNIRLFEASPGVLDIAKLNRLPYFKGNEARHAFFDVSDNFTSAVRLPILFIRCDVRTWMLKDDPNTIQMAWPINPKGDLDQCVEVPSDGFKYDVSFVGWNSGLVRKVSATACKNNPKIKADVMLYPNFYGYIEDTDEGRRRRADFIRSLKESRMVLCPESIASVIPYRFFEAMAAGRYPVLISRDYVLPFSDLVPYDEFISRVDRDQADEAGDIVAEIRSRHTDEVFAEKGRLARKCWEQLMDSRKWPAIHAFAVGRKLRAMGLTKEEPLLCR